ncbi:MAG TPA: MFS transporter [Gaiellaceae bacterium]|nr:MFS transporter [Gaiellaceae bacterium]
MDASPLPLRTKLLYATSSLGSEALGQSRSLWLLYFYAKREDAELLPLVLVGVLLTVGRLIESLDDALIGYWSDRTRSRLGRRIPFVLAATPPWAVFSVLLFTPPSDSSTAVTALYFFAVLELFYLFATLSGGPYEALLPEIATTSAERVHVASLRVYLGVAGAAVGLVGSDFLKDRLGFKAMALVIGVLALVCRYVGLIGIWRRASRTQPPAAIPFREAMRVTFANKQFLAFLPTFVLFQIGFQMLIGVLPYFVDAVLEEGTWVKVRVLTGVAIASTVAAVPLFALLARRTSKRHAYSTALAIAAVVFPLLSLAGFVPGVPREAQALALMAVAGIPIAGNYLFPATLTADIIDFDSIRTGLRREATYYGAQNFVEKTATSVSPLLLALLLLAGRTADDPLGVRLVGPVAGLVVLFGYLAFRFYSLPDEVRTRMAPGPAG